MKKIKAKENWEIEFENKFGILEKLKEGEIEAIFCLKKDAEKVKDFIKKWKKEWLKSSDYKNDELYPK